MNKLTKLLSVFVIAGAMAGTGAALSGCSHKHTYSEDWSKDADKHWHAATCEHSDEKIDEGAHADENQDGKCDSCGYNMVIPQAKYSITYNIKGHGTAPANVAEATNLPETLPTLTEEGWTFGGWFTDEGCNTAAVAGAKLTSDITLYAKWTQNQGEQPNPDTKYSITYNVKGHGTAPANIAEATNLPETLPTLTEEGWTFGGWFTDEGCNTAAVAGAKLTSNITLYAKWTQNQTENPSNNDNAIVTPYEGEAEGPAAGLQNYNLGFKGSGIEAGTLSEAWTDGVFTIASGAELRNRKDTTNIYTRSVKNGVITVEVPTNAKLTIIFASGSSSIGSAKYKLTKPDGSSEVVAINTADKVLNTLEINAEKGTYKFEKSAGTVDVFECKLAYSAESAPIKKIEITSAGTTDYLVTQKVDCTNVELVAIDENSVPYTVNLKNCKFDTSKYNPNASGEYEIGVTYYLASNLDSETKQFTATYKVKVYMVDSIKLSMIGLASNKQVTVQQAYLPDGTFNKDNLSVIANCKFGNDTIEQKLKADWFSVSVPTLTAEGKQTVTVTVNTDYTTENKSVTASYDIIVKAKKEVVENMVEVTVGETGEFKTITQAVQYLKACAYESGVNKVIKVQAGTYTEKVWLDIDNVTLMGTGDKADDTTLTYSLVEGDADALSNALWALNCATLHVTGNNFKAYNIAIRNDFDYIKNSGNYSGSQAAQGVALTLEGDGNVLYSCHLFGNQDTLYMKSGRTYYYKTQIDGNIDFIFGGETGLAYFEECDIVAINRETKISDNPQNGYVTAPQHKVDTKPDYGYIFYKCNLTDDGEVANSAMSLGRPWGPAATVAYIECKFSAAYSQEASDGTHKIHRWNDMSGALPENADYSEYGSIDADGNPIMQEAVKGGSVLATGANHTKANIFGTSNGKVKAYATAFDCDGEYAKLRILVGLDEGKVEESTSKTYDLTGFTGGQLQGAGAIAEYLGIKIDATNGKFNVRAANGDVQINTGTILKVPMNKRYKVMLTDNKSATVLPGDDYSVEYVTEEGQLYAKITITKSGSFYAKTVIVDGTVEMPETAYFNVSFDLNYTDAETSNPVTVIGGYNVAKPADPSRDGWTFNYWYAGDDDSVEYDFNSPVTSDIVLKAKWTEGATVKEAVLIETAKDFNFGKGTGNIMEYVNASEQVVDGLLIEGTTSANGDWTQVAANTTIKLKVKAGLSVEFTLYKSANFEIYIDGIKQEITGTGTEGIKAYLTVAAQGTDVEITLKCTAADYIGAIQVTA